MNITTLLSLLPLLAASVQASYIMWKGIPNVTTLKIHTDDGNILSVPIKEGVDTQSTLFEPEDFVKFELIVGDGEQTLEYDYDEETMLKLPPCKTKVIALVPGRHHTGNLRQLRKRLEKSTPYSGGPSGREGGKCPYKGNLDASSGGSKSFPQ